MTPMLTLAIQQETERARVKHPHGGVDIDGAPERALAILGEEYGEACQAMLDMTRPHNCNEFHCGLTHWEWLKPMRAKLGKELIQVASVTVRILEQMAPYIDDKKPVTYCSLCGNQIVPGEELKHICPPPKPPSPPQSA